MGLFTKSKPEDHAVKEPDVLDESLVSFAKDLEFMRDNYVMNHEDAVRLINKILNQVYARLHADDVPLKPAVEATHEQRVGARDPGEQEQKIAEDIGLTDKTPAVDPDVLTPEERKKEEHDRHMKRSKK